MFNCILEVNEKQVIFFLLFLLVMCSSLLSTELMTNVNYNETFNFKSHLQNVSTVVLNTTF